MKGKAQQALDWLRAKEDQVEDEQLFNIGYMIPIVDLAEVQSGAGADAEEGFLQTYRQLLEGAMATDQLSAEDVATNRQFLTDLEKSLS